MVKCELLRVLAQESVVTVSPLLVGWDAGDVREGRTEGGGHTFSELHQTDSISHLIDLLSDGLEYF